jgi:hypothetical protein
MYQVTTAKAELVFLSSSVLYRPPLFTSPWGQNIRAVVISLLWIFLMPDNKLARLLAYVTGLVNQKLLLKNEYLIAENRILRAHLPARMRLSDPERSTLAEIGKRLGRHHAGRQARNRSWRRPSRRPGRGRSTCPSPECTSHQLSRSHWWASVRDDNAYSVPAHSAGLIAKWWCGPLAVLAR